MKILKTFIGIITIALVSTSTGCFLNKSVKSELDSYIKAFVELGKFSGSVLVAKDGKVLLCKGYGMASYEHDVPNTPQTKFRLGSITKQFTAMAIMQLQEQGALSVNDTLLRYIPDYPNGDKISIHHLLTHTSGIPNVTSFPEYRRKKIKPHTLEQLIERFKNKPLDFKPGEKYKYSNSGYMLLSYIIEKTSDKKYETFLKENIFDPLKMNNSGYDRTRLIIKNRASGYSVSNNELINTYYIDMSFPAGAGGLYSTVENLFLWDQTLYSEKLLSKESLATIFTSHVIKNSVTPNSSGYGYGWDIETLHNRNVSGHNGGIDGFSTHIDRYPDDRICTIVLSNCDRSPVRTISQGLAAIVFGEKYEFPKKRIAITVNPVIYDQYVGKYRFKKGFIITISKENNKIFAQAANSKKFEICPESETKFFYKLIDLQISFVKDESNNVTKLIFHQGGKADQVGKKIE